MESAGHTLADSDDRARYRAEKKLPVAGEKVLDYFLKARQMMKTGSDATAKPIIAIQEWLPRQTRFLTVQAKIY